MTNKLKDNYRKKLVRIKANEEAKKKKQKRRALEREPTPPPSDSENSCSDSDPSEDNLEEDELDQIHLSIRKSKNKEPRMRKTEHMNRTFGGPVRV